MEIEEFSLGPLKMEHVIRCSLKKRPIMLDISNGHLRMEVPAYMVGILKVLQYMEAFSQEVFYLKTKHLRGPLDRRSR